LGIEQPSSPIEGDDHMVLDHGNAVALRFGKAYGAHLRNGCSRRNSNQSYVRIPLANRSPHCLTKPIDYQNLNCCVRLRVERAETVQQVPRTVD
jgi:hypothetical protein